MKNTDDYISYIKKQIELLPKGNITYKTIRGVKRMYLQWYEDGLKKSRYIKGADEADIREGVTRRKLYEEELKELEASSVEEDMMRMGEYSLSDKAFRTSVFVGDKLKQFVSTTEKMKKRGCFRTIKNFLELDREEKVFILYGLRRTGKTTLIKQTIAELSHSEFVRTAFIQVRAGVSLGDINSDFSWLLEHGYKYVFVDEVTLAEDFIEGAALFSDIYAASGMKIVLSGTDSLGFLFSSSEELYDRCIMLHTTWIPYGEFENVLGLVGIDEYIRFGGTMSLGGLHYNEVATFKSKKSTDEYIDSAIARNIQHSLQFYHDGGHFRHLFELFEKNELTSVINRVIEDINHRFTIDVLTRDFESHDLGISKRNLRKDREKPTDILDHIDTEAFTLGLRRALDILNKNEQSIEITDAHRSEIKEYLDLLDLTVDIPIESIPVKDSKIYKTVIAQPGMRYAQAEALVRQLLLDKELQNISAVDRSRILERILDEIRGRMMEDIVLLETKMAYPEKEVFCLQFAVGEFDMVVVDPKEISCEIFEIKHSTKAVPQQYANLINVEKCNATEFRFGRIKRKAVIYRGEKTTDGEVEYLNVEDYLKDLLGEQYESLDLV